MAKGPQAHGYQTAVWTIGRVAALINKLAGVKYHFGHAWRILRSLGWTPKRPVGRAVERNKKAITHWKKKQWPAGLKHNQGSTDPLDDRAALMGAHGLA